MFTSSKSPANKTKQLIVTMRLLELKVSGNLPGLSCEVLPQIWIVAAFGAMGS